MSWWRFFVYFKIFFFTIISYILFYIIIWKVYIFEFLDISKLVLRGNTFYSYKPYKPFTGKVISYRVKNYDVYDLSRLREDKEYVFVEFEGYLKNGKRHGKWIWWKNEKHGWHEATFKNGWKIKN